MLDSGFVLHRRRYRETSLIVELLTLERGRVSAVAKGALRAKSKLGTSLQPLIPLSLDLGGRNELMNLYRAESTGPGYDIHGDNLYSVLYINELITKLTAVHDPHPNLLANYQHALQAIAGNEPVEPVLRRFECAFLEEIGFGLEFTADVRTGEPIEASVSYVYVPEHGPTRSDAQTDHVAVSGACLAALAGQCEWDEGLLTEAKRLMRRLLEYHLDGRTLKTRELFAASKQLNA